MTVGEAAGIEAGAGAVLRRAPFSDNPAVGPRGQRTQQRILDATLDVLRDEGYHRCSVDRITARAGCSRVSFYQYFSGKDDVFQHLASQVARQARASVEALGQLTADASGRDVVRAWMAREAELHQRYGPLFQSFGSIAAVVAAVAELAAQTGQDNAAGIRARLVNVSVPPRELDAVVFLLTGCIARSFHIAAVLSSAAPDAYPVARISQALGDVVHRSLFGLLPGVNVHEMPSGAAPPPRLTFSTSARELLALGNGVADAGLTQPTLDALLAAGREAFTTRGFHGTRIDDVAAAAGLSHGAFYQYFKNKGGLAHVLIMSAMRPLGATFAAMPTSVGGSRETAALRRWLRRYNDSHVQEAAIIRIWVDAQSEDAPIAADAAPALDWARRRVADFLRPRGFGDAEGDAVVMVALMDTFGSRPRSSVTIDAVTHIIQRGLLGQ